MDHKNGHILTNIQRQKLSIAVVEPACWDPSPEGLPQTVLSIKSLPKSTKILPWSWDFPEEGTAKARSMRRAYIYIYGYDIVYVYMHEQMCIYIYMHISTSLFR